MAIRNALPFEFITRWADVWEEFGIDHRTAAAMDERDRELEDFLANRQRPLIFHWPETTEDLIDVRNGPGWFDGGGTIRQIKYVWDTAPATGVTVAWYFDGSATATWTHSLGTADEQTEVEVTEYVDQHIVAVVTAADATASGLTAWVFLD